MFTIIYHEKVMKDIQKLGLSKDQKKKLMCKIEDVSKNPYPKADGGLGEPLKGTLKGLMKFRFDNDYRVVYQLILDHGQMKVLVIGLRSDKEVCYQVEKRK